MSTKIPEDLKERVAKLPHINWSDIMRTAIIKKLEEEESKMHSRDQDSVNQSLDLMDKLRRKASGNSTEELREWRELRH